MTKYDLALVGLSDFTLELKKEFDGRANILFVDNSAFKDAFSTDIFPNVTFIPQTNQVESLYGQLITPSFRFDLTPQRDILNLLWNEELLEDSNIYDVIEKRASLELSLANFIVRENYGNTFFSLLREHLFFLIKNYKTLKNLYLTPLPKGERVGKYFISALRFFFAPGEANTELFDKYLFYSVLSNRPYKIERENIPLIQRPTYGFLKGITLGEDWELRFEKEKITAKVLVSALTPHIYSLLNIQHPFKINYEMAFFCLIPESPIEAPTAMEEELVFMDEKLCCFIKYDKDSGLKLYLPLRLGENFDRNSILPLFRQLFPHVKDIPTFRVIPHIYPFFAKRNSKNLTFGKNIYFCKNFEYPFFGIDGEMLYRKRLKEILWKKLL